jgi:RNA polymerase sigma factor (sigma-70 family)
MPNRDVHRSQDRCYPALGLLGHDAPTRIATPDETAALCLRAQAGDAAALREAMMANMGLVWKTVRRFTRRGVEIEDLVQEGMMGLARAVEKFDPQRGFAFSTYAVRWIWQRMSRLLRSSPMMAVPDVTLQKYRAHLRHGRKIPSAHNIDRRLAARQFQFPNSAGIPISISDPHAATVGSDTDHADSAGAAMSVLTDTEKEVIMDRFWGAMSPEQCAMRRGITKEKVRQIEAKALEKMRTYLNLHEKSSNS